MSNREPSPVFLHTESKFIEEFNKTFTEKLIIQDLTPIYFIRPTKIVIRITTIAIFHPSDNIIPPNYF